MLKAALNILGLFALWILMSGIYKPLIVGLGAISAAVAVYIIHRMDREDGSSMPMPINPIKFLSYMIWLMKEIAVANWTVTKTIVASAMPINQKLFSIPHSQKSDIASVLFANSITLTPGTITIETEEGYFLVHALSHHEGDFEALADMDARVSALETSAAQIGLPDEEMGA